MTKQSIFLVALLFLFSIDVSAQLLNKGNFMMGSTVGFSTADSKVTHSINNNKEEGEGPSSIQINFAPKVGYFIVDNFALGIGLDYTFSTVREPNTDRTNDSDLLFGPYARYYLPVGNDMSFFFEADFGFGTSSDQQYIGGDKQSINTNIFAVGAGPGFTILSTADIGIEALLKYNFARGQFETESAGITATTKTITNQFDFAIGIEFYFGGVRRIGG
jgi:hypothetical protein